MMDKRLIEVAFPLRETSIDAVHEKNVRHGHISTLHIWPARRPLAACRAALIATLLPDPGDKAARDAILKRLGGTLRKISKPKKMPNGQTEEIEALETQGGILHWGRESGPDLNWFRAEIRKAYGGRAPRVLDPFAGGGAIPLEAMRLGCEVTAMDINPVAWFILKCTLDYPQRLAGQTRRLPDFALQDPEFMADYFKAKGLRAAEIRRHLRQLGARASRPHAGGTPALQPGENLDLFADAGIEPALDPALLEADLAWHVRAWGRWVLNQARRELAPYYPTYAEFCSLKPYRRVPLDSGEPLRLVPTNDAGIPQIELLNSGFDAGHLENPANPRWISKPTVAYLWARTVRCKSCRATIPLLKTCWLAKKDRKRVLLTLEPNAERTGIEFGIDANVREVGANPAKKREHDKTIGAGTMSRAGATCPCCDTIMTMKDIRIEALDGRLGVSMTTVVVETPVGKGYRVPTDHEIKIAVISDAELAEAFAKVPFGIPTEPVPLGGSRQGGGSPFTTPLYGLDQWSKLFSDRQLLALAAVVTTLRKLYDAAADYPDAWRLALVSYQALNLDKLADYGSALCTWHNSGEKMRNTFPRFALQMVWDTAETVPINEVGAAFTAQMDWIARYLDHALLFGPDIPVPVIESGSATVSPPKLYDAIVTDPPYYDAIPYSDLMDFFYVWLRRTLHGLSPEIDAVFSEPLAPKWDHEANDGELIDDSSRFGGDKEASKRNYESGMARAFQACHQALRPDGRLVIVFAHKHPDAWETLVGAVIRAGFVVDASWPIQTEMGNRTRALASAALSSSVWLVCRKREPGIKPGWDNQVLKDMETSIRLRLREFWDAGIRGPDFVWAATGPALESYSRFPAVRKAAEQNAFMGVNEFLAHVRRMVVDFVVGRVLTRGEEADLPGDHPLDDVTTYYLLHRADFGLKEAPAGPCILYAISCGLSERDLADHGGLLIKGKGAAPDEADESGDEGGSGGKLKLKPWKARTHRGLAEEPSRGRPIPLIDHCHRLMQLWVAADVAQVNAHLDRHGLRQSPLFAQLIQALIEQSRADGSTEERSLLERLANHLRQLGSTSQTTLALGD